MVLISKKQRDFNDDLGSYLDNRNYKNKDSSDSVSFFKKVDSLIPISRVFSSSSEEVPELSDAVESTVYEEGESKSFFGRIFSIFSSSPEAKEIEEELDDFPEPVREEVHHIEDEIEEVEHEVEALEEKRESLLKRLFGSLFKAKKETFPEEEEFEHADEVSLDPAEVLKAETRQTLKIIHKWISRLPPEQIDAFKRSPDFVRYKELLEKYNLLK